MRKSISISIKRTPFFYCTGIAIVIFMLAQTTLFVKETVCKKALPAMKYKIKFHKKSTNKQKFVE